MYLNSYDDYQVTGIVLGTLSIVFSTLGQKSVKRKKLAYIGLGLGITLLSLGGLFIVLKVIGIDVFNRNYNYYIKLPRKIRAAQNGWVSNLEASPTEAPTDESTTLAARLGGG